jgi:hypothetical protein
MPLLTIDTSQKSDMDVDVVDELTYTDPAVSPPARGCCDWTCLMLSVGDIYEEYVTRKSSKKPVDLQ